MSCLILIRWHYGVLLFHTLAELFSIVIGILMLVVVWNTRQFTHNDFLIYLGIGYFWIAFLDTWHTFTIKGMPFFDIVNAEPTLHLWIYARLTEALLLLSASLFLKRKVNAYLVFYLGAALSLIIIWASVNLQQPIMLTAGGLTNFKIAVEYLVIFLLCIAAYNYIINRQLLSAEVLYYLLFSIILTVSAEFFFTQYTDFNGVPFVVGHLFKFLSFWMIYQAIVLTTLKKPFSVMALASNSYDAIPHVAVVVDKLGMISQLNRCAENEAGLAKEVLLHQHIHKYFHPENTTIQSCELCTHIYKGQSLDSKLVHFPEKNQWMVISLAAIKSANITSGMIQSSTDVTAQVIASQRLEKSETKYRNLIKNLKGHYFIYAHDAKGMFTYVSDSMTQILGYTADEFLHHYEKYLTDDPINKKVHFYTDKALKGETQKPYELSVYHKDASIRYIEVTELPVFDDHGKVTGVDGIARDITDKHFAEHEKDMQQRFLQSIIDGIHDPVMVIDKNYQVKLMNTPIKKMMNNSNVTDITNPKCYEVFYNRSTPCDGIDHVCSLKEVISTKKSITVVHNHLDLQGIKHYFELSSAPLWNDEHNFIGVIESSRDITNHLRIQDELRKQKDILSFQVHHDILTQLPNRLLLLDRLKQSIKKAYRNKQKLAVLFIDLDHFKEINDSLGHNVGDQVLINAADRLKRCVRETDTVARLGGDEFTVLIEDIYDNDIVTDIAANIIEVLQKSFVVEEHSLYVTSSIGISLYPHDAESAGDLLRNADAAMYKAKDEGRNTYRFYTEDMTQKAFEHILMERNLRHALKNNDLIVYYQPQVNGKTNQIVGMEALVRWQHKELGLISPARFIPLAEKTGLIIPLGEQVFDQASEQMALWMKDYELTGRMSINLSFKQLQQENIVETLLAILKTNNCETQWIELEITEDHVMNNPERAIATLQKLQENGIEIAIDDFGTGYSSLSYLKHLPINKLKIDQSFVRDIAEDEDNRSIITSTISLAKNMKLNVIAEGVETIEQKQFILEQGCDLIQGYYYSRPVPEKEMTELLNSADWQAL